MTEQSSANEVREMSKQECFDRLYAHGFGRLAVVIDDAPFIFPMNYVFSEPSIIFRTTEGSKMAAAPMSTVAFEIDGAGSGGEWGWSVVCRGRAHDITDSLDQYSEDLRKLSVETWAPGPKDRVLRMSVQEVSGRLFGSV